MRPGSGSRLAALLTVILMVGGGLLFLGVSVSEFSRRGFEYVVMAVLGEAFLYSALVFGPVGRAIARMLEGGHSGELDQQIINRLADIEDRLGEISGEVTRVVDLESRVEFAERLLNRPAGSGESR